MDVEELGKFARYNNQIRERREVFINRLYKYIRHRYFGGLTRKYISLVLSDWIRDHGVDFVRVKLQKKIADSVVGDDTRWKRMLKALANVEDAINKAVRIAEELRELPLTTQEKGRVLGEFAATLSGAVDDTLTPSPFSHEVCV